MRPATTAAPTGPSTPKTPPTSATRSQANNSENDQSDGTGDLNNGNFTVNHLQIANLTVNSVFNDTTVNTATFGFQYWNNLIASHISAPLVTFPSALVRHQHQRSAAVVPAQVAVQGRLLQGDRQAHLQGRRRLHLEPGRRRLLRVQLHARNRLREGSHAIILEQGLSRRYLLALPASCRA